MLIRAGIVIHHSRRSLCVRIQHFGGNKQKSTAKKKCQGVAHAPRESFPWEKGPVNKGYWDLVENRRAYFDWLGGQVGVKKKADWYKLSKTARVSQLSGHALLIARYGSSVVNGLLDVYPSHAWQEWLFHRAPEGFWKVQTNQRRYLDWLYSTLGFSSFQQWYQLDPKQLSSNHGNALLAHFNNSISRMVIEAYPDHEWEPWLFKKSPPGVWNSKSNRIRFGNWAERKLGIVEAKDWYQVTSAQIRALPGGGSLLHEMSVLALATELHPTHTWLPWRFSRVPDSYWDSKDSRMEFLNWVYQEKGMSSLDDWYQVPQGEVMKLGGAGLVSRFGGRLSNLLQEIYPEHAWNTARFQGTKSWRGQHGRVNQRHLFDYLFEKLKLKAMRDWYSVTQSRVKVDAGGLLASMYNNSLASALMAVYPDHSWEPWRFNKMPSGWLKSAENRLRYIEWLSSKLGITKPEDWYSASTKNLREHGATALLLMFDNSLFLMLSTTIPGYSWQKWRFDRSVATIQSLLPNEKREFTAWVEQQLGVTSLEDWYRVSATQRRRVVGMGIPITRGAIVAFLRDVYPDHPWDSKRFSEGRSKKAVQKKLVSVVKQMFPHQEVREEYELVARKGSVHRLRLDVYVPELSIALEYDGEQHVEDTVRFQGTGGAENDATKAAICNQEGIRLVIVPHTWNGSIEQVQKLMVPLDRPVNDDPSNNSSLS